MQLSKFERKLLAWLARQARPVTRDVLEKAPGYDARRLESLRKRGFVFCPEPGFSEGSPRAYAITDEGRAALESDKLLLSSDRRSWVALAVSVVALIVSVIALLED